MVARTLRKLTVLEVKNAKPSISPKTGQPCAARYGDGGGLYLHVNAQGRKSWIYRWKVAGKAHEMGLGGFSDSNKDDCRKSLIGARERAEECREMVAAGKNPKMERDRAKTKDLVEPTFWECVERYYADKIELKTLPNGKTSGLRNAKSRQHFLMTMREYAKPLNKVKVSQITIDHVLQALRPIWDVKRETASKTQGRIERVLSYATAMGWRSGPNPAQWTKGLDNILPPKPTAKEQRHFPALAYSELPDFMDKLRDREGVTARLTEFAILTVARSKQARLAKFQDIDFETGIWSAPANDMKGGELHTVPLCSRALEIIAEAKEQAANSDLILPPNQDLIFPHPKSGKMLSENASRALLHRMGYAHITLHGFRATFKTFCTSKTNFARELIEMAMAHKFGSDAEMAYLRETAHEKRLKLMQAWSDYCAGIQSGEVVRLHG